MKLSLVRASIGLLFGAVFASSVNAQFIDTTPTWNGTSSVSSFGEFNTGTYGQTFRTPVGGSTLTSFTFWLRSFSGSDGVDFAGYVMEWDTGLNRATGSILYQSTQQLLPTGTATMTPFVFNTGSLDLDSTKQYVAFLSASNFFDGSEGTAVMGYLNGDVYSDGGFWFSNNGNNFGSLTSSSWQNFFGGGVEDTAFKATFTAGAVPEPSTYGLIGAACLLGVVAFRRRR